MTARASRKPAAALQPPDACVSQPLLRALCLLALLVAPAAAWASGFPQQFAHRFGVTEVGAMPERVVSLGYTGHDDLLALGVVPVALRYWYGDWPRGVWPWAEAALGEAQPVVLRGDLSMERIAALAPDLIIAISSGITAEDYAILSQIAPTIGPEARYGDFGTPWEVRALTTGRATGREELAQGRIGAIRARMAAIREAHPDWQGKTAVAAYYWAGTPGVFRAGDPRAEVLTDLGFVLPPAFAAPGAAFFTEISSEDLTPLDVDLLLWVTETPDSSAIAGMPLRPTLRAVREGREVLADPLLAGALSHASLLSIPYTLDRLVPEIAAAVDGDPATPVPSAVAAGLAP